MEAKELFSMMHELRYDWIDEIPERIISNSGSYKCRGNWFQAVFLAVGESARLGFLEEMTKNFNGQVVRYCEETTLSRRNKNVLDIRLGNYLLDMALHDLGDVLKIDPLEPR